MAVAVITGGTRGIGAATAVALSEAGLHVVIAVREPDRATDLLLRIRARGGTADAVQCDVSRWGSVERLVSTVLDRHGGVDVLVNNAGTMTPIGFAADTDPEQWSIGIDVNLKGAYYCCRAVMPALRVANRGTILNLSSGAAFHALEGWSAYCCAKAGLAMLTRVLALELKNTGIRVYGFQPGMVDTEAAREALKVRINRVANLDPAGFANVRDPAAAIRWLCEHRPEDLNGAEVVLTDPAFRHRMGLTFHG